MRDWLHPDAKVVCVHHNYSLTLHYRKWFGIIRDDRPILHNLNEGEVYTIKAVVTVTDKTGKEHLQVYLEEAQHFGFDWPFPAVLFRPLQKRKTSIEVFERLLNTAPEKPLVEA